MLLFETSAKDPRESQNVDSIFMALACRLKAQKSLLYRDVEREDGRVRLTQETETKSNCPCWGTARVDGATVKVTRRTPRTAGAKMKQVISWPRPFLLKAEIISYRKWRIEIKCECLACPTDTLTGVVFGGVACNKPMKWSEIQQCCLFHHSVLLVSQLI